jgi:hypothetical protein
VTSVQLSFSGYGWFTGHQHFMDDLVVSQDAPPALTPAEMATALVAAVVALQLPAAIEHSYLAHLKKVERFITHGQTEAAIEQLRAFLHKLRRDLDQGRIDAATFGPLANAAEALLARLS